MTPHLYRSVVLEDDTEVDRWNAFYTTMGTIHPKFAQIQNLIVKNKTGMFKSIILKDCSSIQYLVMSPSQLPCTHTFYAPMSSRLTHLTLIGPLFFDTFSLPFLRTITHLHVCDDVPNDDCPIMRGNLPKLTHLVCTLYTYNVTDIQQDIRDLVEISHNFPKLCLFAVYLVSPDDDQKLDLDVASFRAKIGLDGQPPTIIRREENWTYDDSDNWIKGGESVWDQAERKLFEQGTGV